jgi:hypothetical protein
VRESGVQKLIQLALGRLASMFRQNVGQAWTGDAVKLPSGDVLIRNPRPIRLGLCKGSSDLIGWRSMVVTAEMVGRKLAIFTAVEVKALKGRPTDDQQNFIDRVREAGGFAGIARSPAEALAIIGETP